MWFDPPLLFYVKCSMLCEYLNIYMMIFYFICPKQVIVNLNLTNHFQACYNNHYNPNLKWLKKKTKKKRLGVLRNLISPGSTGKGGASGRQ